MSTKQQIKAYVYTNTGIHFNELVRESPFATGQVQYHIRRLIDNDELIRGEFYGRTHYYPPGYEEQEQVVLALLRRETTREIAVYVFEHESTTPSPVTDALGIARSTLEYHLNRLIECNVIEKQYDDQSRVLLRLQCPKRTGKLLSVIEPTVSDQLIDRYTRLVDELLETSDKME